MSTSPSYGGPSRSYPPSYQPVYGPPSPPPYGPSGSYSLPPPYYGGVGYGGKLAPDGTACKPVQGSEAWERGQGATGYAAVVVPHHATHICYVQLNYQCCMLSQHLICTNAEEVLSEQAKGAHADPVGKDQCWCPVREGRTIADCWTPGASASVLVPCKHMKHLYLIIVHNDTGGPALHMGARRHGRPAHKPPGGEGQKASRGAEK